MLCEARLSVQSMSVVVVTNGYDGQPAKSGHGKEDVQMIAPLTNIESVQFRELIIRVHHSQIPQFARLYFTC